MYPRSKRTEFRKAELRLEPLEDRQLFSGGVSLSLLQPLIPLSGVSALVGAVPGASAVISSDASAIVNTVRLTPVEVAAVLQESKNLLAASVQAAIDNPLGLALTAGGHADLGQIASLNLQATIQATVGLFQPGVKSLVLSGSTWGTTGLGPVINLIFSASTGGTSGLGPVINLTGTGTVNPGSPPIPNVQVNTWVDVGKEVNFGLDNGFGNAFGVLPTPGESAFPPPRSLADAAVLDLLLSGPSNASPDVSGRDFKDTIGLAESGVPSKSEGIDRSGHTGEDSESFAPQTDDLQEQSRSANPHSLNLLFQSIFGQMGNLGRDAFSWLAHLGWVSWLIGIAIAAAVAGTVLHKRFRRAPGVGPLPTKSVGTPESWWFSFLK